MVQDRGTVDEEETIQLRFILDKKMLSYEIGRSKTVSELKATICEDLDIDDDDLTLSYLGIELDSARTIESYNFMPNVLLSALAPSNLDISDKKVYLVSKGEGSEESG